MVITLINSLMLMFWTQLNLYKWILYGRGWIIVQNVLYSSYTKVLVHVVQFVVYQLCHAFEIKWCEGLHSKFEK